LVKCEIVKNLDHVNQSKSQKGLD